MAKKISLTAEPADVWGNSNTPRHSLIYPLWERVQEWIDECEIHTDNREKLFDSLHAFLNTAVPYTVTQED